MTSTMDDSKTTSTPSGVRARKRARRRYARLIVLNVARGASSAAGAAVVSSVAVWLRHR